MNTKISLQWRIISCIGAFFIVIHYNSFSSPKKIVKIAAECDIFEKINGDIFNFIVCLKNSKISYEDEYELKLLIRNIPKKLHYSFAKQKKFQNAPFFSYFLFLKKELKKIVTLQRRNKILLSCDNDDGSCAVVCQRLVALEKSFILTISYLENTEGYFHDLYQIHLQKEGPIIKVVRSLANVMLVVLGIDCAIRLYVFTHAMNSLRDL